MSGQLDQQTLYLVAVGVIVLLALVVALVVRLRARQKPIASDAPPPPLQRTHARVSQGQPGSGVPAGMAAAVADVIEPLVGADLDTPAAAGDDLTRLKGLGPKAAARLGGLGVSSYRQIAHLSEADAAAIDAQMGPFAGRLASDRWQEQAQLLADGDVAGFEARFGKLGG